MQLTSVAAIFTTVLAVFQSVHAQGDFSATCSNIFIQNNNILRATCGDGHGGEVNSALDLNSCIGIAATDLVCRANGNYAADGCSGCEIETGAFMICGCPGSAKIADLDDCVVNRFGLLACVD